MDVSFNSGTRLEKPDWSDDSSVDSSSSEEEKLPELDHRAQELYVSILKERKVQRQRNIENPDSVFFPDFDFYDRRRKLEDLTNRKTSLIRNVSGVISDAEDKIREVVADESQREDSLQKIRKIYQAMQNEDASLSFEAETAQNIVKRLSSTIVEIAFEVFQKQRESSEAISEEDRFRENPKIKQIQRSLEEAQESNTSADGGSGKTIDIYSVLLTMQDVKEQVTEGFNPNRVTKEEATKYLDGAIGRAEAETKGIIDRFFDGALADKFMKEIEPKLVESFEKKMGQVQEIQKISGLTDAEVYEWISECD